MEDLKTQEFDILSTLYDARKRVLRSDLDPKNKGLITKYLEESVELVKDNFAIEYFKINKGVKEVSA